MDLSVFELGHTYRSYSGVQSKMEDRMANSVDPGGTASFHQKLSGFIYMCLFICDTCRRQSDPGV